MNCFRRRRRRLSDVDGRCLPLSGLCWHRRLTDSVYDQTVHQERVKCVSVLTYDRQTRQLFTGMHHSSHCLHRLLLKNSVESAIHTLCNIGCHSQEQIQELIFSERQLTFAFAICYRPSVCRLSVTLVRPTQAVAIFGNISTAFGTMAIRWHPHKILRRSSQGNPSALGVKHKRGSQI